MKKTPESMPTLLCTPGSKVAHSEGGVGTQISGDARVHAHLLSCKMKAISITIIVLTSFDCLFAQTYRPYGKLFIASNRYTWKNPDQQQGKHVLCTRLFDGSAKDMEYLSMD